MFHTSQATTSKQFIFQTPDIFDVHKQAIHPLFTTARDARIRHPQGVQSRIPDDSVIAICPICAYPMGIASGVYHCGNPSSSCPKNISMRAPEQLFSKMNDPLKTIPVLPMHASCGSCLIGVSTGQWSKGQIYMMCGCKNIDQTASVKVISLDLVHPSKELNSEKKLLKEAFDLNPSYYAQNNLSSKPIKDAPPLQVGTQPKPLW